MGHLDFVVGREVLFWKVGTPQVPPLRFAQVGMTNLGAGLSLGVVAYRRSSCCGVVIGQKLGL
jgi:hypothetical protein